MHSQSPSLVMTLRLIAAWGILALVLPVALSANPSQTTPTVTITPESAEVVEGGDVTFAANVTGTGPLTYRWKFQGAIIPGRTGSTLRLANVTPEQSGPYSVEVGNAAGTSVSPGVLLTVRKKPHIISQSLTNIVAEGSCSRAESSHRASF